MKILWTSNITFPAIAKQLNLNVVNVGGWLIGLANVLKTESDFELGIVSIDNVEDLKTVYFENVTYFILPKKILNNSSNSDNLYLWNCIIDKFKPELIHINGTEQSYALSVIKHFNSIPNVVSIQGLLSVYSRYFSTGYTFKDIFSNPLLSLYLFRAEMRFRSNGELEKEIIQSTLNVIGRTDWDRIHCLSINPSVKYHFCNETLRPAFYKRSWDINKCQRHSVFISQATHTTKGFHLILPAIRHLVMKYPDLKIVVAGNRPWIELGKSNGIKNILSYFGYGAYLRRKIKNLGIGNHIEFIGNIDENQMSEQLLNTNVFLMPSSIENSPNSLGEAQLLGVPCVASYVGGIPNMTVDKKTVLVYRCTEWEMLVEHISSVFESDRLCIDLSNNAREEAKLRHSTELNVIALKNIYKKIIHNA